MSKSLFICYFLSFISYFLYFVSYFSYFVSYFLYLIFVFYMLFFVFLGPFGVSPLRSMTLMGEMLILLKIWPTENNQPPYISMEDQGIEEILGSILVLIRAESVDSLRSLEGFCLYDRFMGDFLDVLRYECL